MGTAVHQAAAAAVVLRDAGSGSGDDSDAADTKDMGPRGKSSPGGGDLGDGDGILPRNGVKADGIQRKSLVIYFVGGRRMKQFSKWLEVLKDARSIYLVLAMKNKTNREK